MSDIKTEKTASGKSEPKDYTLELPMYDLGEAIKLVTEIHEKALETATMANVATECGYAGNSSTPFYRRIVASRLFKLLSPEGAKLTIQALDYLKPDTDEAKQAALTQAIMGIKIYSEIVNLNVGRKINKDLIANKLAKDATLSISTACAKVCASTLENSLKFAGFISADGTVVIPLSPSVKIIPRPPVEMPPEIPAVDETNNNEAGYHTYILPLPKGRKITIKAPLDVTQQEIERLNQWTKFTLFLDWKETGSQTEIK